MLRLRQAQDSDCALLFAWANDTDARRCSIHSEPITLETHTAWFRRRRNTPGCLLLIAEDSQNTPVGQIRFDVNDHEAVASISLDAAQRGKGFATHIITIGTAILMEQTTVYTIHAWIKPENLASQRAFERAGFSNQGLHQHQGLSMLHYTFQKSPARIPEHLNTRTPEYEIILTSRR